MLSIRRRIAYRGRRTFTDLVAHQTAAAEVERAKRGLLRNLDVRPLDRRETARIRAYARAAFGSAAYAPRLEF